MLYLSRIDLFFFQVPWYDVFWGEMGCSFRTLNSFTSDGPHNMHLLCPTLDLLLNTCLYPSSCGPSPFPVLGVTYPAWAYHWPFSAPLLTVSSFPLCLLSTGPRVKNHHSFIVRFLHACRTQEIIQFGSNFNLQCILQGHWFLSHVVPWKFISGSWYKDKWRINVLQSSVPTTPSLLLPSQQTLSVSHVDPRKCHQILCSAQGFCIRHVNAEGVIWRDNICDPLC